MTRPGMQGLAMVPLQALRFHPRNIRTNLGDLDELAASIRHQGVLVPLMAQRVPGIGLQLLHGHRRWAAADMAGLRRVPVVITEQHLGDDEVILLMLAEDQKRSVDLDDRRRAVETLRAEFDYDSDTICERLGIPPGMIGPWLAGKLGTEAQRTPRATPPAPRHTPRPRRASSRPRAPRIRPVALHGLITSWADRAPAELLDELRHLLGGWEPAGPIDRWPEPTTPLVVEPPIIEPADDPELPDGHPVAWDDLEPHQRDAGGYWLDKRWIAVLPPLDGVAHG